MIITKQMRIHIIISLMLLLVSYSCREELSIYETENNQPGLESNSNAAGLMQRVSLKDGSIDNIIDNSSSISVKLPVTVIANGITVHVNTEDDLATIERIFNEFNDDDDELTITFPITVILSDFSEVLIRDEDEFEEIIEEHDSELDDDIECIDFVYPIKVSTFDVITEQLETLTINDDETMFNFLDDIDDDDIINIEFPISMILSDGTPVTIANLNEMETAIDNAQETCDEDDDDSDDDGSDSDDGSDDSDGDDDDSVDDDDPQLNQFMESITSCDQWTIEKFEINDEELEEDYQDYTFSFTTDNKFVANKGTAAFSGTWDSYKNGENIILVIKLPDFPNLSSSWSLEDIEEDEEGVETEFSKGENSLLFSSTCS
ncbi:hypothetical protein [Sunxiuqinia elliptica]|uniref:Uncharacterized protein n=1 Tax=Sunxiuqinia elliptica TaxID=655355 RepID=A0A4R6H4Z0_9BACT|nr:hypothetical protein [Sunxiuqinia elliptica]TDO03200.1 hypothetical protein DET52_103141 [Sunxiuqinia elliptica]TDO59397.1 hypothetical protein DET65_2684 [Sunxiuqinia elliptica]